MSKKLLCDYPDVLTPKMLAEILGIGYTKALNVVKYTQDLPTIRIGNTFRIHKGNLEKWLESAQKRELSFSK
ncbi:MAG: helix-turn-helix domain-containing protein [Defluviitaleaceae bacterium]|nr:helix-turn-helix domain-containing protein [Defluviitaleaceae bacterium]MCL2836641.1 helix-turn-helix domain-containing protein [Defluviitaleaceae bacterium]